MFQMVALECHGKRDPDGQISKYPETPVCERLFHSEACAVGNLVNGKHEGVVDDASEEVGGENHDRPRLVRHDREHTTLDKHQEHDLPFEQRIHAEKFLDLRIFFCEGNRLKG